MDKNAVKLKSISIETPFSAGMLHQFLSAHSDGAGVKLQNSSEAPVIKVRKGPPKKLDIVEREAWSFYLDYLYKRLVGMESAEKQKAGAEIESLLKEEPLKLTVGMLLVPLQTLMAAEQARLNGANGLVKRWLANEKDVLKIALQLSDETQPRDKVELDKAALETACNVLSRFSDCKDGEIDSSKILDEAFDIGRKLSTDEYKKLGRARMILLTRIKDLGSYIGGESPGLVDLCINAHETDKKSFRSDEKIKITMSRIVTLMQARTDTEEYLIPPSPRTIAGHAKVRTPIPQFKAPDQVSKKKGHPSTSEKEKRQSADKPETSSAPPKLAPPPIPPHHTRNESGDINGGISMQTPPPSPRIGASSSSLTSSHPPTHSDALKELKGNLRPLLRKVATDSAERVITATASTSSVLSSSSTTVEKSSKAAPEKAPVTAMASSHSSTSTTNHGSSTTSVVNPVPREASGTGSERKKKRVDKKTSNGTLRTNSEGQEQSTAKLKEPLKVRTRSMPTPQGLDPDNPASVDAAFAKLKEIGAAAKATRLEQKMDSEVFGKWEAAEKELQSILTVETGNAMRRILSFCHEVNLEQGEELASLQRVVMAARPRSKEIDALVSVRNILLAESRNAAPTKANAIFPELLSMLIFTIDADRIRRADRAAPASS